MDGYSLYPAQRPDPSREHDGIQSEINLIRSEMRMLDSTQSNYAALKSSYDQILQSLLSRLQALQPLGQPLTSNLLSAPRSPGGASSGSRKRSRDESNGDYGSVNTTPGEASPETPLSIEYPGYEAAAPQQVKHEMPGLSDYIDLTADMPEDEPATMPMPNADPFPELFNAYQPGQPQPVDAFNQEWISTEELAQFLLAPTPADGAFGFGTNSLPPPQLPSSNRGSSTAPRRPTNYTSSDEELFGADNFGPIDPGDVQDLIENIRLHEDLDPEAREQTPSQMCSTLMEHQKIALTWLLKMERGKSKAAILADEMGLGKTVEALALVLANPSTNPACKTTLIVAPVALMRQWEKEVHRHVHPRHRLSVYVYHGTSKKADFDRLRTYDVVLTTFGTLAQEMKVKQKRMLAEAEQRQQRAPQIKRTDREMLTILGHKSMWYRVILDEAQCIKNRNTLTSKAADDLQARHRLCMTGTPMMNSIDELFALIRFLKISPYNVWGKFSFEISKPLKTKSTVLHKRAMGRVQAVLKSIMLRRGKTTVVDGKQICEIPPKHTHMQKVDFSEDERALYQAVETQNQLTFNRYLQRGTVNNNYANVLVMLLRLRQICDHPRLVKDLSVQVSTEGIDENVLMERARLLADDVVQRLSDTDSFECPICYETDANSTIIVPCGHTTCGECFQKLVDPSQAVREGNENSSAKCPHCRGALSSDMITDFKHFCKVFCPEKLTKMRNEATAMLEEGGYGATPEADSDSDTDSEDEAEEDNGDETLGGFIVPDEDEDALDDAEEGDDDSLEDLFAPGPSAPGPSTQAKKSKAKAKDSKGKAKKFKKTVTLAQLKKDSLRSASAKRKYLRRLRKGWETSAKISKTMELLSDIRDADPTEKTLVFSQFTAFLDLLEVPLTQRKFKYQRYDGSMRMDDRAEAVNQFMDDAQENIMLVSLKAGNAGLNLSKASQVIILDPFWNPFVEEQAVDRAHRMPQKREVHVHRVLVPETVEDRICALQDKKRDLINTALDEGVSKSLTRLSVGELKYLFGLGERN